MLEHHHRLPPLGVHRIVGQLKALSAERADQDDGSAKTPPESASASASASVILNSVVVFSEGFSAEVKGKLVNGLLAAGIKAVSASGAGAGEDADAGGVDGWTKSLAESSWLAGHFSAPPIPLATISTTPIRQTILKFLLEEGNLNPKQQKSARDAFAAVHDERNRGARGLLSAAAVRESASSTGAGKNVDFVVGVLSLTPSGRVLLNAWRFAYELVPVNVLVEHGGGVGLYVVPLNLELDPGSYAPEASESVFKSANVDPKDLIKDLVLPYSSHLEGFDNPKHEANEQDAVAKWAESSVTPEGHVILLGSSSSGLGSLFSSGSFGEIPFKSVLFKVFQLTGKVNVWSQAIEVKTDLILPNVAPFSLGSVKGSLTEGVTLRSDLTIAKGSFRFYVDKEKKQVKVDVDVSMLRGVWKQSIMLIQLT
ncbi:hypothetical protein AX16_004747 [Volvariella volvacea WC 439]|nr:hypothetical protein AX16_004747 [Volvariella volvacea WC 439]